MRPRWIPVLVGITALAAACSGDDSTADTIPADTTLSPTTVSPSTAAPSTTSTAAPIDKTPDVDAAWTAFLEAWALARVSDPIDAGGLEAVAVSPLAVRVRTAIAAERVNPAGGTGWIVSMEFETTPLEINVDGDTATWEGCTAVREVGEPIDPDGIGVEPFDQILIDRQLVTFTRSDSDWLVESVETVSDHCVPPDLDPTTIEAIVAAYEEYWDRRPEFLDPPDPASPTIAEVAAGGTAEFLRDLAQRMADEGAALRGRPETHPELSEYGLGTAVIVDCQALPDDWGAFGLATGERRSDILEVVPDQRDVRQTFLAMEEGRWKVALLRDAANVQCEFGQLTSQ